MTRKPISITVAHNGCLYVIADDGTIWHRAPPRKLWIQIEDLPQPEPGEKPLTSAEVRKAHLIRTYGHYEDREGEL